MNIRINFFDKFIYNVFLFNIEFIILFDLKEYLAKINVKFIASN